MRIVQPKPPKSSRPLRVGYVALCDCAPLLAARELGLFAKYGLRVELTREVGWATIRDKIVYRELDAAHALAPMVFAASFGLGSIPADCVTGLVLSSEGNAITLAQSFRNMGADLGQSLREYAKQRGGPLVLGIPFRHSSHFFLLRLWARSQGLDTAEDVQLAVAPPPQMPGNLKSGHFDGYCVGEPWNTFATTSGFGWRVATSADIAPWHPEKVLMVRREFAESRAGEHERLIAAVLEGCRFCAASENRDQIIEILAATNCLNISQEVLRNSTAAMGYATEFSSEGHEPSREKAAWVIENMIESGLLPKGRDTRVLTSKIFRADIFQNAIRNHSHHEPTNAISRN